MSFCCGYRSGCGVRSPPLGGQALLFGWGGEFWSGGRRPTAHYRGFPPAVETPSPRKAPASEGRCRFLAALDCRW